MRKIILKCFTVLLAVTLLSGALPVVSSASDNELVLTKIGHTVSDTVSITNASTRAVTLTVPFSYSGTTLDLSTGLIIEKSSSIEWVNTTFSAGYTATIGDVGAAGSPVSMTVTYAKNGASYSTEYTISVTRAAKKTPVFTGTVTKAVTGVMPNAKINDVTFSAADFTNLYTANDSGPLTQVSLTGSSLSCGSLKYGSGGSYSAYPSGKLVSITDIGNLVFDATGSGTVSYIVSAYAGTDTGTAIGSVVLTISVNAISVPAITGSVSKAINAGSTYTFSLADFSSLYSLGSGKLDTIEITPASTSCGVWYNGSNTFTGTATFTSSAISNLKFTSSTAGTAGFAWRVSNEAGFSSPGSGTITVKTAAVPTITGSVNKSVNLGSTLTFSLADFSGCYNLNNGTLANIVITPVNSSYGTWYKGSNAFTGSKTFNSNDIATLKFKGTMSGQAAFTWTVSNEKGTSAAGNGTVSVTPGSPTINYTTGQNAAKAFSGSDFSAACREATGANLNYVYFSLPPAAWGTLNYGYTSPSNPGSPIASDTVLYYNNSPKISNVAFVPSANYTGALTISYTGVNVNGISYTGYVKITVGSAGDISYYTAQNTVRTFSGADFNTACANMTGTSLSYVYFTLPPASSGTLYYGYSSPSNPGTAVSANSPYALQSLSAVSFVPAANYSGTLSVQYTGVASNGTSYTGYIKITVGGSGNVTYIVNQNTPKTFSANDFYAACVNATGTALSYIVLSPPAASNGAVYFNYASPSNPGSLMSSSTYLYMTGTPNISYTAFIPAVNYSGTVTIPYTGVNTNGTAYNGSIILKVANQVTDISYTMKDNATLRLISSDFNKVCLQVTGANLNYVTFTLPSVSNGRLYYNDAASSYPGTAVSAGTAYYLKYSPGIDNVTFIPAVNYTGTFSISYTGYSVNGNVYTGSIAVQVNNKHGSSYFTDVGLSCQWAAGAIDFLFEIGVVKGTGNNQYSPGMNMTRGDFMLMLYRALGYTGSTKSNFSDVPKGSYYYDAIAIAKDLGIVKGNNNKFSPASPITRQDAMVFCYRALLAIGVTPSPGSSSDLSGFTDRGQVSKYAQTAVQSLVKAGIIKGIGNKLNPGGILSRAEMAVVFYRVLNMY